MGIHPAWVRGIAVGSASHVAGMAALMAAGETVVRTYNVAQIGGGPCSKRHCTMRTNSNITLLAKFITQVWSCTCVQNYTDMVVYAHEFFCLLLARNWSRTPLGPFREPHLSKNDVLEMRQFSLCPFISVRAKLHPTEGIVDVPLVNFHNIHPALETAQECSDAVHVISVLFCTRGMLLLEILSLWAHVGAQNFRRGVRLISVPLQIRLTDHNWHVYNVVI